MSFFTSKKTKKEESSTSGKKKRKDVEKEIDEINEIDIEKLEISMKKKPNSILTSELNNELNFNVEEGTTLEKLGISSLRKQPMTTIINNEKTKLQVVFTLVDIKSGEKLPTTTKIPCFGCHRCFTTIPLGIPIEYHPSIYISKEDPGKIKKISINERTKLEEKYEVKKLEYFDVDGIVCSFNCIISVLEDSHSPLYSKTRELIPQMYKLIFGKYPTEKITRAPHWRLREEYGGPLNDNEFISNLQILKFTDTHQVERINRALSPCSRIFKVSENE